jgi:RNA-splicing ligase RtcB
MKMRTSLPSLWHGGVQRRRAPMRPTLARLAREKRNSCLNIIRFDAPGAYKDSMAVVKATLLAGRSHKVATIAPHICIKG